VCLDKQAGKELNLLQVFMNLSTLILFHRTTFLYKCFSDNEKHRLLLLAFKEALNILASKVNLSSTPKPGYPLQESTIDLPIFSSSPKIFLV